MLLLSSCLLVGPRFGLHHPSALLATTCSGKTRRRLHLLGRHIEERHHLSLAITLWGLVSLNCTTGLLPATCGLQAGGSHPLLVYCTTGLLPATCRLQAGDSHLLLFGFCRSEYCEWVQRVVHVRLGHAAALLSTTCGLEPDRCTCHLIARAF